MKTWALQDAKARLSEVVRLAAEQGPQGITLRGEPTVVIIAQADYERMIGPRESLVDFMQRSPLADSEDVAFERDQTSVRDIEF